MPDPTITHVAELTDPTTGHTVEIKAGSASELQVKVEEHLEQSFPSV